MRQNYCNASMQRVSIFPSNSILKIDFENVLKIYFFNVLKKKNFGEQSRFISLHVVVIM